MLLGSDMAIFDMADPSVVRDVYVVEDRIPLPELGADQLHD
jgi:hypothetical protein